MAPNARELYSFANYRLDVGERLLLRDGVRIQLPEKAFDTLCMLVRHDGHLVSKDELLAGVWPDAIVEENNLDKNVSLLRRVLGEERGKPKFIETVRGRGYRFLGEVIAVATDVEPSMLSRPTPSVSELYKSPSFSHSRGASGNLAAVVSLVDWRENRNEASDETTVSSLPEPELTARPATRFKLQLIAAAVAGALFLVVLSFVWFGSRPGAKRSAAGDLTFLKLTNGEPLESATISPDGNYFVYASYDNGLAHLWLQQTKQANPTEIITPFDGGIYGTTFTPDSRFVYFFARENASAPGVLYRVATLGGVRTKILSDLDSPVSFSPNGQEMVFVRWDRKESRSSLVIASSDGVDERTLFTRSGDQSVTGAVWSPQGKVIGYTQVTLRNNVGQCAIAGVDIGSGENTTLSSEKWDTCFRMAWTHDGKGLVLLGTKFQEALSTRRDQVFYVSISDGQSRRLTTDGNRHQYASLGVTNDDEILVVPFDRLSQIWSMDAGGDSRTAIQLTTGNADGRGGIEPMADGRLSYLTRNGDGLSIWVMNSDGSGRTQLTADPDNIEELRAGPNGKFYVFAAKLEPSSHLYRVDEVGENLTQLTFGDSQEIDSTVSPDGNWIVYSSSVYNGTYGRFALFKIASLGGSPVRLGNIECITPHYSPDGESVSCVSPEGDKILVVSAEDGAFIADFATPRNSLLNPGSRWTPDSKALAYISFNNDVGNVWIQPVNHDPKYQLTTFTSGSIYNFAFGLADSRLYLSRGYSSRHAVLISNFR